MATRTFADLSSYRKAVDDSKKTSDLLNSIIGGLQQGVQLGQLPQTLENQQIAAQLNNAIAQQKLNELQTGKIIEVGNNLVRQNPDGTYTSVYSAPSTASVTPESQQFVGFDANNQAIVFGPKSGTFRTQSLPSGVSLPTGGLLPKTTAPETQQFAGFDADRTALQFGNRGSGITAAPVQGNLNVTGPLQPKTQTSMRKGVLIQDGKGNVTYDVLAEGESVPEGSRIFSEPKAEDEAGLRKEFLANEVVKDFTDIAPQYQRIQSAMDEAKTSKNFTAVDQTLVNTFNRILDPKSVVRESEYARTSEDQSVLDYLKGKYDPRTGRLVLGGAGLTSETRQAMQRMAERFYNTAQNNYTQTAVFYSNIAKNRGRDPSLIIPPIGGFSFSSSPAATDTERDEALKWIQANPNDPRAAVARRKLGL